MRIPNIIAGGLTTLGLMAGCQPQHTDTATFQVGCDISTEASENILNEARKGVNGGFSPEEITLFREQIKQNLIDGKISTEQASQLIIILTFQDVVMRQCVDHREVMRPITGASLASPVFMNFAGIQEGMPYVQYVSTSTDRQLDDIGRCLTSAQGAINIGLKKENCAINIVMSSTEQ
ncbi:hypothetical protein A2335_04795 [Candidatus Peregrinibacteria bacterium RIFOXYB2_FULL_32_7]|nr:MAG: hypothetical protein A2335_04795 [Candidatus Peregrinibacteria bacterium RIFOXYB2_FULL_32_7]